MKMKMYKLTEIKHVQVTMGKAKIKEKAIV